MIRSSDNLSLTRRWVTRVFIAFCLLLTVPACNRLTTPRRAQLIKDADTKSDNGDFMQAIGMYEAALDGTPASADVHYRLAVLYDDKMNDPLNALHHFKRYLALAPEGSHAADAKTFMKRDELALLTNLSGDTVLSRAEATRLRNENLALRRKVEEMRAEGVPEPVATHSKGHGRKSYRAARSYVVKQGDTLASISRKFYNTSTRWKEIRAANASVIDDPQNLKIGTHLVIP